MTKSGTNRFRGSFYDYERHSGWNENSWANKLNGTPKAVSDQRDWGYTIGGPVGKPGGNNKLFFFYTSEYRPRTSGNNLQSFRFPTALERQGDFSATVDNNGAAYNLIYNPNNAGQLPKTSCAGAVTTACFADGGVLGSVPTNRLYGPGIAILNQYPLPNCPGPTCTSWTATSNFNYQLLSPITKTLSFSPTYRVDYNLSSNFRVDGQVERHHRARAAEHRQHSRLQRHHPEVPAVVQHLGHGKLDADADDIRRDDIRDEPEPARDAEYQ